jgi:molecular chaperone DnaK (HSP70)
MWYVVAVDAAQGETGASANHSNVVIFDLGGGTFDVSVLSMDGGKQI